jgi:hypothetical protein
MSASAFSYGNMTSAAAGGVTLSDNTISHLGTAATRSAGLRIHMDGTVTQLNTYLDISIAPTTDWIIPNGSASASYDVRITNLVWISMDEGFILSPSGTDTFSRPPNPAWDGASDGDEDTWYDLGTDREWYMFDNDSTTGIGVQHATFNMQIRRGTTILATADMDWHVSSLDGGGGGGGGCFMYDTEIRMADNSLKNIQDIELGDVMKAGGKVKAVQIGDATKETWYDCDGVIATGTHTICKDGVWMGIEDAGYPIAEEQPDRFYIVSNQHHQILAANGQLFTDYQEVDYMSSGWDDWVVSFLNGESNVDVLRDAIISTGLESKRAKDYLAKEGMYEEDYYTAKGRLLGELDLLEQAKEASDLLAQKK